MRACVISIGNELVSGATVDTNAAYLARELTAIGWAVLGHLTVGDDRTAIAEAVKSAMGRVDLVVITGGLGPTADDVTREGIADALGVALEPHPQAEAHLREFYKKLERRITPSGHRQTLIPVGCEVVANPWGTAPAIAGRRGQCRLFALPGVPSEMRSIFQVTVLPAISVEGVTRRSVTAVIRCFGTSEASVGEKIADLMASGRNPVVGVTADSGVISVRITSAGHDEAAAKLALGADMAEVRSRLGRYVFGEGDATLPSAVAELLNSKGKTIATAESCTGGLLAKWLTDIPGSSAYFLRGYVTYANQAKTDVLGIAEELLAAEGAVSEPVARLMAQNCRREAGADLAVSITGIAGPPVGNRRHTGGRESDKPVGLVFFGFADEEGVVVKRVLFGSHLSRDQIRQRGCRTALNVVRLRLITGVWA